MEQSPTFFDPTLFLLFGFMILIYFLMIRPENKRRKTHQEMLSSIEMGEEIVTAGGILGKVTKISDQYLELSVSTCIKKCTPPLRSKPSFIGLAPISMSHSGVVGAKLRAITTSLIMLDDKISLITN